MSIYLTQSKKQSTKLVDTTLTPIHKLRATARSKINKFKQSSAEKKIEFRSLTPNSTDESFFGSQSDISATSIMEGRKLRRPVSPGLRRSPRLTENVTDQTNDPPQ